MLSKIILRSDIFKVGKSGLRSLIYRNNSQTTSDIETVDLAYTVFDKSGDTTKKPPLVILHGIVGSRRDWDVMGKAINEATGRKVIAVDARNHGDSPHTPHHTYNLMAYDVLELLKKLELTKISILGHSMGAGTAMVVALMDPSLVTSLIVEDLSPYTKSPQARLMLRVLDSMAALRIKSDVPMSKAKELAHEHLKTLTADVNIRNYLIDSLVNTNTGWYAWKCNIPVLKEVYVENILNYIHDFRDYQYTGPTLFIGGSLSGFLSKTELPVIRKHYLRAELTFIEGAGHWVHSQKPKEFLEVLSKFLNDN